MFPPAPLSAGLSASLYSLGPFLRLIGRQRGNQVIPARFPLPQGPQVRKAPVVDGKQVKQQAQRPVAAVL